jgi:hypothetical protein
MLNRDEWIGLLSGLYDHYGYPLVFFERGSWVILGLLTVLFLAWHLLGQDMR